MLHSASSGPSLCIRTPNACDNSAVSSWNQYSVSHCLNTPNCSGSHSCFKTEPVFVDQPRATGASLLFLDSPTSVTPDSGHEHSTHTPDHNGGPGTLVSGQGEEGAHLSESAQSSRAGIKYGEAEPHDLQRGLCDQQQQHDNDDHVPATACRNTGDSQSVGVPAERHVPGTPRDTLRCVSPGGRDSNDGEQVRRVGEDEEGNECDVKDTLDGNNKPGTVNEESNGPKIETFNNNNIGGGGSGDVSVEDAVVTTLTESFISDDTTSQMVLSSRCLSPAAAFTDDSVYGGVTAEELWLADEDVDIEVLCGRRVNQMTKTYNDIDAVTKLLEEKENDLELAARIGQQLVARNRALEERQCTLEAELAAATDTNTQLQHQLTLKTNLLSIYTDDIDDTSSCDATPSNIRHISVDLLEEKVRALQQDNKLLRDEANRLAGETSQVEERENNLMHDVIKQLDEANTQVLSLSMELKVKSEETLKQHEETTQLLAQIVELQAKLKESTAECEELQNMVAIGRECQQELVSEVADLKEKYAEVRDLLHGTQEQLRRQNKKSVRGAGGGLGALYGSSFVSGGRADDSIASELSCLDTPTPPPQGASSATDGPLNRVFDTVRLSSSRPPTPSTTTSSSLYTPYIPGYASYTPGYASYTPGYSNTSPGYTSHTPGVESFNATVAGRRYGAGRGWDASSGGMLSVPHSGHLSLDSGADSDLHTDTEDNYPASCVGVPGYPGTPDLSCRVRRLRPAHSQGSGLNTMAGLCSTPSTPNSTSQPMLPYGVRTPDSIMATGGHHPSSMGVTQEWQGARYPPNKLQIIKPMEGSHTLHQWSRLATPNLVGVLEPHQEGIAHRGGVGSRSDMELYSLSDLEEDEEQAPLPLPPPTSSTHFTSTTTTTSTSGGGVLCSTEPRKQFMETSGVYTYTNSTILHVDDCTQPTQIGQSSLVSCSIPSSSCAVPSALPSSILHQSMPPSRRGSTATFSTNVGLARVLQERGVGGSTTAGGGRPLPTATPANSPEGSGYNTPVPGYYTLPGLQELRSTLQLGASYIRRTLYPSPPSSPTLTKPPSELMKKVSSLPPLSCPHPPTSSFSPLSVGGVIASRSTQPSPLLHLSNLIRTGAVGLTEGSDQPPSDLPSPDGPPYPELPSPGTRRPPLPPNVPLGVPAEPGKGYLDRSLKRVGPQRMDLGTVPRPPSSSNGGPGAMGQLRTMTVGRKGGLL